LLAGISDAGKVDLKPATTQAFERYIQALEARLDQRVSTPAFLWMDGDAGRKLHAQRSDVVVEPAVAAGDVEVPEGLLHDWVGAMFVRGATLEKVIAMFEDYDNAKNIYKPEVVDSKTLEHTGNNFKVYMRLLKKQVVTVVLTTTHDVRYVPVDPTHWYSKSYSVRIAELQNAGKSSESELPPGHDHGFLWRLNSYWRFEERDGGGGGEVEASFARGLGNADDAGGMGGEDGIGDAGGFAAEDQPVAVGEPGLPERRFALGGKEPEWRGVAAEEIEE